MTRADPQFNLRLPADIKDSIQSAADANKRSLTAEIIARLDESFDEKLDYKTIAEHALNSMEEAAALSRREVAEYRSMSSQIGLMRHLLSRVLAATDREALPLDLRTIIDLLAVERPADSTTPIRPLLKQALADMEAVDAAHEEYTLQRKEREAGAAPDLEARIFRHKARFPKAKS